jgi:hypothetical protein
MIVVEDLIEIADDGRMSGLKRTRVTNCSMNWMRAWPG